MESQKVTLGNIGVNTNNTVNKKNIRFTAAPEPTQKEDTVEINGEVKTQKKKISKDKKILMTLGGLSLAGAGLLAAIPMLKRGKFSGLVDFRKPVPFSHEPVLKQIPTTQELDAKIAEKIKNVNIDYGFDDSIKTEQQLRDKLKQIYGEEYLGFWLDTVIQKAATNDDARYVLRALSGKNFTDFSKSKLNTRPSDLYSIINNIKGPINRAEFDKTIKLISADNNTNISYFDTSRIIENGINNLAEQNRVMALDDIVNNGIEEYKKISVSALSSEKNKFDDLTEFLSVLKKGTITNKYGNPDTYTLQKMLTDENVNIKSLTKFLKSLNHNTSEHVNIKSIQEIYASKEITPKAASEKLNSIPENILKKMTGDYDAANYIRFEEFADKKNINELTLAEKKKLMDKLIKNNSRSFDGYGNRSKDSDNLFPLIPSNQKQYCETLQKLAKSIGISTKQLTPAELQTFENGLQELGKELQHIDFNKIQLEMKMSRKDFTQKAMNLMEGLEENERRKVMDYFGFEINNKKLKGYPINLNNGEKLQEIEQNKTKAVIERLRPIVKEFSEQNPITVVNGNKAFEKALNDVLSGLPELRPMIGKPQHKTHAYTLDLHTLKVLQGVTANPKFATLSKEDKKIVSIASLLHDVTKTEGLRDPLHPMESAFDAYYIIQKMNLPEEQQLKVYELIKSHNWLDRLNNPKNTAEKVERIAQDIAFDARHTNTFELAKILCEADLKAVRKDPTFFDHHKKTLQTMSDKVDGYLKRIHETQIVLPQTEIPKASKLTGATEKTANGIKNKVIYMDQAPDDLSTLGFAKGTTKDNWRALVHALDHEDQMSKFNTFSVIDTEALLSTSYIDSKNYRVFRKQGFILDVNSNDIHAGYYRDFGTGYSKDIELLKSDYLFQGKRKLDTQNQNVWSGDRTEYRDYISGLVKKKMNINDAEYVKLMEKIQSCKSITDIEKVDKNFADNLQQIFGEMDAGKRRGGRQYNEMLVTRPKIQAVFAYDSDYNKIPKFLRKYAQDNDLPIIIFGK